MKKAFISVLALLLIFSLCACSNDIEALLLQDSSIGVLAGTSSVRYAEQRGTVHEYHSYDELTAALKAGTVSCAIIDEEDLDDFTRFNFKIRILSEHLADSNLRIAAAKECPDLVEDFNAAIAYLKDEKILTQIYRGHYESSEYVYEADAPKCDKSLICVIGEEFIPYKYTDENGEPAGIDIDVVRAICAYLGYDVTFVTAKDNVEMFRLICDGTAQFAIGGITENSAEEGLCIFTDSYATCSQVVAVRR